MNATNIIGFSAAISTTIAFVPQVIKTIKTKSVKDISLIMYIIFTTGIFLWLVYGILINSKPVILANIVTFILALIVLMLKIKYKN